METRKITFWFFILVLLLACLGEGQTTKEKHFDVTGFLQKKAADDLKEQTSTESLPLFNGAHDNRLFPQADPAHPPWPSCGILRPTIGFPTIQERGKTFLIKIVVASSSDSLAEPDTWIVTIKTDCDDKPIKLDVLKTIFLGRQDDSYATPKSVWELKIVIPNRTRPDLYDLTVEVEPQKYLNYTESYTRKNAVQVIKKFSSNPFFIHLTDLHIGFEGNLEPSLKRIVQVPYKNRDKHIRNIIITEINILHPDFVVITGDLVDWSEEAHWDRLYDALAEFRVPVFTLPGNHEYYIGKYFVKEALRYVRGDNPGSHVSLIPYILKINSYEDYSFDYGSVHIACMNSGYDAGGTEILKGGTDFSIIDKEFSATPAGSGLTLEQVEWLESDLIDKTNVFIFMHHPFLRRDYQTNACITKNRDKFWDLCRNPNVLAVVSGHTHKNENWNADSSGYKKQDDLLQTTTVFPFYAPDPYVSSYRIFKVRSKGRYGTTVLESPNLVNLQNTSTISSSYRDASGGPTNWKNDAGHDQVNVRMENHYNKPFQNLFLKFMMPYVEKPEEYKIIGGTCIGFYVMPHENEPDKVLYYVSSDIGANETKEVTIRPASSGSITPPVSAGLATALVMDKSGSMSGEKIRKAKEAAYVYVDTGTEQQDVVSLVAFATDAQSIAEPIAISEGREKLKQDILHVSAGGSTNVGAGLTTALQHLSSSNRTAKKALLMSDGRHNTGTYKPEVAKFQSKGWPIYTVAFGRDADQDMLRWIANQTGGIFYPAEESDIASVYHKINVLAHNGSVYRSYNDFIKTGEKLTYNIPVEPDMKKVGFFTNWQGSRMETILFSPNKTVISRSNISNWGRFVEGETHNCYEIENPQFGTWQVLITGYNLPPKGEQVNFHSFCQSDFFSNVLGFQPRYSRNQEVRIGVKLAEVIDGRLSPLRGARITAEIKKPSTSLKKFASDIKRKRLQPTTLFEIFKEVSGFAQKITLFDDGLHQDVMPNDGIYANTYNSTTINGPYLVTIDCQGSTSQGMPVKRTLQESFQVGPIEQNSFTISEFLDLIAQKGIGRQIPKREKEQKAKKVIDSVFKQLFKRK